MPTTLFSDEHEALRDSVRRWVERDIAPAAAEWEAAGRLPDSVVAAAGAQGWLGLEAGAAGSADPIAALVVAEEFGRARAGGVTAALLTQSQAVALLAETGDPEDALAGDRRLCLLLGGDATVAMAGGGLVVDGHADAVTAAVGAHAAIVLAEGPDGAALVLVGTEDDGWSARPAAAPLGRRSAAAGAVTLRAVAARLVLARGDDARVAAERALQRLWLATAAAAVAGSWDLWERTREYALQREAFGRPIAGFQVNRHALAEAATHLSAARQLVHDAYRRLATTGLRPGDAATAKLVAARTATAVADRCLQLHGGYGYMTEYDVSRAWRDDRHTRLDEGPDELLRERIAAALEDAAS